MCQTCSTCVLYTKWYTLRQIRCQSTGEGSSFGSGTQAFDVFGGVQEVLVRLRDVGKRLLVVRLALLERLNPRDLLDVVGNGLSDSVEEGGSLDRRPVTEPVLGLACRLHGSVDIGT